MLGAIESLLSAVIADGMTGKRHDPDAELVGQGLGNLVAPFFGGIAATGALARTATNVRAGARSPIAAVVHALVVLASVLLLAPLVALRADGLARGAACCWSRGTWPRSRHFAHMLRVGAEERRLRAASTCFVLTVAFDMVLAVSVGVVLAALCSCTAWRSSRARACSQDDDDETDYAAAARRRALRDRGARSSSAPPRTP